MVNMPHPIMTLPTHRLTPTRFPSAAPRGCSATKAMKNAATASLRSEGASPAYFVNPAVSALPRLLRSRLLRRKRRARNGSRCQSVRRRMSVVTGGDRVEDIVVWWGKAGVTLSLVSLRCTRARVKVGLAEYSDQSRSISVPSSIIILSLVILIPPLPCHVRTLETYAMAASGRMQYDYKQTNTRNLKLSIRRRS